MYSFQACYVIRLHRSLFIRLLIKECSSNNERITFFGFKEAKRSYLNGRHICSITGEFSLPTLDRYMKIDDQVV